MKKYLVLTKIVFALLFVSPIVFFILGATGTFNIFKIEDELGLKDKFLMKSNNPSKEISALADTRTFLYVEEISSAIKNKYVVQGRSIARGYDSMSFG